MPTITNIDFINSYSDQIKQDLIISCEKSNERHESFLAYEKLNKPYFGCKPYTVLQVDNGDNGFIQFKLSRKQVKFIAETKSFNQQEYLSYIKLMEI